MVDIHSATAEIRRGKNKRRRTKETTWQKYNVRICYAGRPMVIISSTVFTAGSHVSKVGVLLKRLNVGSGKQRHTIAHGFQFSDAKDLGKTQMGSPSTESPNAGGVS